MKRVNVTNENGRLVGWFNYDRAVGRWPDKDPVTGDGSGGLGRGQAVILTASGRWVLEDWTDWQGQENTYRWISADEAREWLLSNHHDDAVEQHFGAVPAEVNLGGRPATVGGSRRPLQAPDEFWQQVDARAAELGVSASEVIRRAVAEVLVNP